VVDARGLHCPVPVIRLAEAARDAAPGTEVTIWWTDPAARYDIPAWARMRGHSVVETVALPDGDPLGPGHATTIRLQAPTQE
jgi:tRNA 2-thiouridine synthesizing protein A